MNHLIFKFTLLLLLSLFATALFAQNKTSRPSIYQTNLIQNAGAELPGGNNDIPNWKPLPETDNWYFMHESYGHTGGEWEFDDKVIHIKEFSLIIIQ